MYLHEIHMLTLVSYMTLMSFLYLSPLRVQGSSMLHLSAAA